MRAASKHAVTTSPTFRDEHASELLADLAALPVDHPERAALRHRTIEAWVPMAERLTRRYARRGEPIEDLRQVAILGLINAIDRFDPRCGAAFVSFALPTILGEIKRHFRDRSWSVRVPRRVQERWLAISEANDNCQAQLGRTPTITDLAVYLQISEEQVIEGLEGSHAHRAMSLSAKLAVEGALELGGTLGAPEHGYALAELAIDLGAAMAVLSERERQIILLRFYGNQTQTRIAEQIGISQMHVSRVLTAALAKLRKHLDV